MQDTSLEILYWEVLPALRRQIVQGLKERGMKQKEIAELMQMTPSAISQYLGNKRGEFVFSELFQKHVEEEISVIYKGERSPFQSINRLLRRFEEDRHICSVCRKRNQTSSSCSVCFEE
jgi:predicted transcriptional regulator